MQEIARRREHELRRSARRFGQLGPRRKRHGPVRYRTGWVLIEIGLALTCGSGGDRHSVTRQRYRASRDPSHGATATASAKRALPGAAVNHPHTTDHQAQRAEGLVSWTGRERLRFLWYRLRLTISEMNYATRRMVDLQMRLPGEIADRSAICAELDNMSDLACGRCRGCRIGGASRSSNWSRGRTPTTPSSGDARR